MSDETKPRSSGSSQRGGRRRGGRRGGRNRNRNNQNQPRSRSEAKSSPGKRTRSTKTAAEPEKKGIVKRLFGWLLPADEPQHTRTAPAKTLDPAAGRRKSSEERGSGRRSRKRSGSEDSPRAGRGERTGRSDRGEKAEKTERTERAPKEPKPFRIEVLSERLYVGNLPYEASEGDVFDLFSKVGEVRSVEIVQDRRSNRSKGFAFVEMARVEVALKAAEGLNKTDFMGREIVVNGAKGERREAEPEQEQQQQEQAPAEATENGV